MGIKTQKVLRLISKIVLILVSLGLIGYAGYMVYRSIVFKPHNVVVTNLTEGSATVTWTTNSPMKGMVYFKKDKGLLPGPLGIVGSNIAYDDRDVSDAQKNCVDTFNKEASKTKDADFNVSGSNFDCENAKVTEIGTYYTHSITITNLDENSTYNFVVGDGIWSFKEGISNVKTFSALESVTEPKPIFGRVVAEDNSYSRDALVYVTFKDGSESKDSILYSSTTNDDGGWYLDASNVRDTSGKVLPLELTNDSFKVKGVLKNYNISDEYMWVLGYFNGAYPSIVVKKQVNLSASFWDKFVMGAYASCTYENVNAAAHGSGTLDASCSTSDLAAQASVLGYGNVTRILNAANGGNAVSTTQQIYGTSNPIAVAGNTNAVYGTNLDGSSTNVTVENANADTRGEVVVVGTSTTTDETTGTSTTTTQTCAVNSSCAIVTSASYCKAGSTQLCTKTNDIESCADSSSCGYVGSGNRVCSPTTCTPTGAYSSVICVNGVPQSYPNTNCSESQGTDTQPASTTNLCGGHTLGYCEDISGSEKKVCSSSGWDVRPGTCSGGTSTAATPESCSMKASYDTNGVLGSCYLSCNGGAEVKIVDTVKCRSIASLDEEQLPGIGRASQVVEIPIDATAINPFDFSEKRIAALINSSDIIRDNGIKAIEKCVSDGSTGSSKAGDNCQKICHALGGEYNSNGESLPFEYCKDSDGNTINELLNKLVPKAYAEDSSSTNSYALYLPEYGLYSFEVDGGNVANTVSDGKTLHMFYVEANNVAGFQMPVDPEKPTKNEDILLSTNAYEITYSQESTAQQYQIKKGINIVSFNFMPVSTDLGAYTAENIIKQANTSGVGIQYISTFDGGRWNSGYSCSSGECTGTNFTIVPGKGYLIYATNNGTVTIPGYNLTTPVPLALSAGWNLVGVHGYTKAYTARSFMDSVNKVKGLTADNVSWWPTSKSKYEGLSLEDGVQYGTDFAISTNNGYFVRISKFAPSDTKCKSMIWNEGTSLNGTCGNSK